MQELLNPLILLAPFGRRDSIPKRGIESALKNYSYCPKSGERWISGCGVIGVLGGFRRSLQCGKTILRGGTQERQVVRMNTLAALTAIPLPRSLYLVIIGYNSGKNQLAA